MIVHTEYFRLDNNFDLIRLIAALQVVVVHGYEHFAIEGGRIIVNLISIFPGVPVFFVISGFLVSASWERNPVLLSYARNRILRIYPALWMCLAVSILTVITVYPVDLSSATFFKWLFAQTTIGQFFNPDFMRGYGIGVINGSLWTIPVEIQFYLLLPLLYFFFNKIGWDVRVLGLIVISLAIANYAFMDAREQYGGLLIKAIGVTVFPYLYIFLIGVLLQRNFLSISRFLVDKFLYWLILYLAIALISANFGFRHQGNSLNPILCALLSLLTISFAYTYRTASKSILNGNDISYGVYIYHMVIVNFLVHIDLFKPLANFFIMLASSLVAALISWKLIEKPALSLKSHYAKS